MLFRSGKSIHNQIVFTRPVSVDEGERIENLLALVFPEADKQSWRQAQYSRFPGGTNRKTGKAQTVLEIGSRVEPEKFIEYLIAEAEKRGLVEIRTIGPEKEAERNADRQVYLEWLFDLELVENRNFVKENGTWPGLSPGFYYRAVCPNAENHSDGDFQRKTFDVFLSDDGVTRKHCWHNSCRGLWSTSFYRLFGFPLYDPGHLEAFLKTPLAKEMMADDLDELRFYLGLESGNSGKDDEGGNYDEYDE